MFRQDSAERITAELTDGSVMAVWHEGAEYDPTFRSYRQRYAYVIFGPTDGGTRHGWRYDDDLRSGCSAEVDVMDAGRTLCSFLSAAADAYRAGMYGRPTDNDDLFPDYVMAWAYQNDDDLALMGMEVDHG